MRILGGKKLAAVVMVLAISVGAIAGCSDDRNGGARGAEQRIQKQSYEGVVKAQPAKVMKYSPTRNTINFWIDTWDEPGKLSYVYLLPENGGGQVVYYYVLEGPPVNMCASLTPTTNVRNGAGDTELLIEAPSVDGVYYSGGQCDTYYGKNAETGSYIEFTTGASMSVLVYDEPGPFPQNILQNLGSKK